MNAMHTPAIIPSFDRVNKLGCSIITFINSSVMLMYVSMCIVMPVSTIFIKLCQIYPCVYMRNTVNLDSYHLNAEGYFIETNKPNGQSRTI